MMRCVPSLSPPCEGTVSRRPAVSQEGLHQEPTRVPLLLDCSLQKVRREPPGLWGSDSRELPETRACLYPPLSAHRERRVFPPSPPQPPSALFSL